MEQIKMEYSKSRVGRDSRKSLPSWVDLLCLAMCSLELKQIFPPVAFIRIF